jgi:hypothetical protein
LRTFLCVLLAFVFLSDASGQMVRRRSLNGYSDDFSGTVLRPKWVEYDPVGDVTVSIGSGLLTVTIPAGTDHDLYTATDHALRLRQTYTGPANFTLEAKFTTSMTIGYLFHGINIGTDNNNFLRFDIVYDIADEQYATAATFSGMTYTSQISTVTEFGAQPYYLRVAKSGTTYTCSSSPDGSTWTSWGSFTWTGTVNQIGIHFGTASGATSPAFSGTCDYFTYTAN